MDAPDARTVEIEPEELAELQPVRRHLPAEHRTTTIAAGEQVEQTARWTRWDWCRWALPWLLLGIALGALIDLAVRLLT